MPSQHFLIYSQAIREQLITHILLLVGDESIAITGLVFQFSVKCRSLAMQLGVVQLQIWDKSYTKIECLKENDTVKITITGRWKYKKVYKTASSFH